VKGEHLIVSKPSGERFHVLASGSPVSSDDQVVGAVSSWHDITIREMALAKAEEAVRTRDEFLSIASHELKTPVTSMLGFSQLTLRRLEREGSLSIEKARKPLEILEQQSQKLANLISQLLDITRIETGRLVLEPKETDLSEPLERLAAAAQMNTDHHAITVDSPPSLIANIDPVRIEQVVTNLLDNAVKYSDGGDIELKLLESDGKLNISVTDHGPGIPPEHREGIFSRFYQVEKNKRGGGMGLGLYISSQIVEQHGGTIRAEFPDQGGTRFVVTLPVGKRRGQE
jgi:signal transduction histidine kinase